MSSIFSDLVAEVLLARSAAASDSEKHLIGSVLGVSAAELYASVLARATGTREVSTGTQPKDKWTMQVVEVENRVTVVPYLVLPGPGDGSGDPNRGNRGFNGKLRDWFDRDTPPGETHVLLTFDEAPIETQRSAMDTGLHASLTAGRLLEFSGEKLRESAPRALVPLLEEVLRFVASRTELTAYEVTRAVHALRTASTAATEAEAGDLLVQLPWLLRDPDVESGTARQRLRLAARHREALDRAADVPTEDFEQLARTKYKPEVAEKLLRSRRLGRVRWQDFTLAELQNSVKDPEPPPPPRTRNRLDPARPIEVRDAVAQVFKLVTEDAALGSRRYGAAALVPRGHVALTVHLERELEGNETLHLFMYSAAPAGHVRSLASRTRATDAQGAVITLAVPAQPLNGSWFFFEVVLTEGMTFQKNYLGRIDVGLLLEDDLGELPYESDCDVDAPTQRFKAADQPAVELVSPDGSSRTAPASAVTGSGGAGGETDDLSVDVHGAPVMLPILYEVPDEAAAPDTATEHSPEHAILRFAAAEQVPINEVERPQLRIQGGAATLTVGGREAPVAALPPAVPRSRWQIEAAILERPELTNYLLTAAGELTADESLQELNMSTVLAPAFAAFMDARAVFFAAIRNNAGGGGTILAADLQSSPAAAEYLEAYAALLEAVPNGVNWQAEYERLLLVDSVRIERVPGIFIAPTSPLAAALHMRLQEFIAETAEGETAGLLAADPDLVSPRYAVPLMRVGESWHESEQAAYPWRLYLPAHDEGMSYPETFLPGFISRRIAEFLDVHPVYRDHRRTLTLAFVNPGDAEHVRKALQATVDAAGKRGEDHLEKLPQFEVKLYAADGPTDNRGIAALGAALDGFMTNAQEAAPNWLEQELMRRLTYTKAPIEEFIADSSSAPEASAFAHIAFIQNFFRPGDTEAYKLSERTSSAYADGLAADLERAAEVGANDVSFSSGVWLGGEPAITPLARILKRTAEVAAAARGNPVASDQALGTVTRVSKKLIPAIYGRAVWVVHFDRHIGLELFYPQDGEADGAPFILDHTDQENLQASGFDAITATALVEPYLALIEGIFGRVVDGMNRERGIRMLRWLNLLSGRWALRLLREHETGVKERLAAVVAFRLLAARERLFDGGSEALSLVISLDELLRVTPKEGLETAQGLAAQSGHRGGASDDLLLLRVALNSSGRQTVVARVIEVKYADGTPPVDKAWTQVTATQMLLQRTFGTSGAGKPFRGRILSKLIRSYVARLAAFGLLDRAIEKDPRFVHALDMIGAGNYEFISEFTRGGQLLIGDFISVEPGHEDALYQAAPYSPPGESRKVGRIRVGGDMISALIADSAEVGAGTYLLPRYGDEPTEPAEPAGPAEPREPVAPVDDVDAAEAAGAGGGVAIDVATPSAEGMVGEAAAGDPAAPGAATEIAGDEPPGEREDAVAVTPGSADPKTVLAGRFTVTEDEIRRLADELDQVFARYGLQVQPFQPSLAEAGPNVLRFRTRMLESGTIGSVEARARDIHRELGIEDPVYIGQDPPFIVVDVPRAERALISIRDVLPVLEGEPVAPGVLPIVMGVNAAGHVEVADLAQMPHLLVAGSTGSGKSVFLSTIGVCLGLLPTERLELVVVDIKGVDLTAFGQLPHTRGGAAIEDPEVAVEALQALIKDEVERRRALFRASRARHIVEHYQRAEPASWPKQTVVIIDEYAQLVSASGQSRVALEGLVQQYAQFARAFGIYLVLATQRPSVDVITGRIKANLPARCVFRLPSFNDSRTVIDTGGAEKLLGAGDMLFYRDGALQRLQAVYTELDDFAHAAARHA